MAEKDLIPMNRRTKDEQKVIARKGGKASGEARRKKKLLKDCMAQLLNMPVTERNASILTAYGLDPKDLDNRALLTASLFSKAVYMGDVAAFKEIRNLVGEDDTILQSETSFTLPATVFAAPFLAVYRDIKAGRHNEYVLYGGRGSTKSSFVSMVLLELLQNNPDMHAVICRKIKDTMRDSVYAQVCWAISELGLDGDFTAKVSPMEIIYKPTGQKIYFRGADDPGKLKSIKPPFGYIGLLWFEELDQFAGDNEIRNIEQSVLRGGDTSYVFKTFNPPQTTANWANKYVMTPKPGRYDHHSTFLDVPAEWLGKKFLEDAEYLKQINPRAYEHEYEGVANGTGGNVFENVTIREITDAEIAVFDHIYHGIDWGWYPDPFRYHAMHYQANERRLFLFDEISGNKLKNSEIAELLRTHGLSPADRITADSGGEGPKSIADFKDMNFAMRGAKKGPGSVEYSMKWLSSLNEIVIDNRRCPCAAEEFIAYEYERDRDGEVISGYPDADNHSIDAVRYALENLINKTNPRFVKVG